MNERHLNPPKLGFFGIYTLLRFSVGVPLTARALSRHNYKWVMANLPTRSLKRWLPSTAQDKRILHACAQTLRMIEKRSPFPGSCLARSIVLYSTLQRYGIIARLRIGVKTQVQVANPADTLLAAHAWVEVKGKPVNAPPDIATEYIPFQPNATSLNVDALAFLR